MRKLVFLSAVALVAVALVAGGAGRQQVSPAVAQEPTPTAAAAFLKLGDLKGEAVAAGYEDQLEVSSWSWGQASRSPEDVTPGHRSSRSLAKPFRFRTPVSTATPQLFLAAASGRTFPSAVLTVVRQAGDVPRPYLTGRLYNVQIVSQDLQAAKDGNEVAIEELVLVAESVEWEYRRQLADGSSGTAIGASWDFLRHRSR